MNKTYIATFTSTVDHHKFFKNYNVNDRERAQYLANLYLTINTKCTLESVEESIPDVPAELVA